MRKPLMLLACSVLMLAMAACGGRGAVVPPNNLEYVPGPGLQSGLPELPADSPMQPGRITAAALVGLTGDQFDQRSPNTTIGPGTLQLQSGANDVAWGLYRFGGLPGETIDNLSLSLSGVDAGDEVFVAYGNYATGRWTFFPPVSEAAPSFALPAGPSPLGSPGGNSYIFVGCYGGDDVTVGSVDLNYPDRFGISGQVIDKVGGPLSGVLVSTSIPGVTDITDATGSYNLAGLPNGDWPVLCTLDGYAFYSQPTFVTLAGAAAVAPVIYGDPHGSRFVNSDLQPNNDRFSAPVFDLQGGALSEALSGDDDMIDCYRFTVNGEGSYLLHFANPARNILSPQFELLDSQQNVVNWAMSILAGEVAICFTQNVPTAEYIFSLRAGGGGGVYSVSLEQADRGRLGIELNDGASLVGGGLVQLDRAASGIQTDYYINSYAPAGPGYVVYDPSYPLGATVATPILDGYGFVPAFAPLNVVTGAVTSQAFMATPPAMADSFEPNNTDAQAHMVALPYNSQAGPDPLQLDAMGYVDLTDYFKCTPTAGNGLSVFVSSPQISPGQQAFQVSVYDDAFNIISASTVGAGYVLTLPTALCNGNDVFIGVSISDYANQRLAYSLQITEVVSPVKLEIAARLPGGELLGEAQFQYFDPLFNRLFRQQSDFLTGLTAPVYLAAGLDLNIDCYRYGMPVNGHTRRYTIPGVDSVLYFDVTGQGSDSLEPNNDFSVWTGAEQSLPLQTDATISYLSDSSDFYKVSAGDGKPFMVTLNYGSGSQGMAAAVYDTAGNYVYGIAANSGVPCYLPNDGNDGQFIAINPNWQQEVSYTLDVTTADAYTISGTCTDGALNPLDGLVTVAGSNSIEYFYSFAAGSYNVQELFPPGNYTVLAFAFNHDPVANLRNVTITNANVVVDFNDFAASPYDNYEPNDDEMSATPINLATDYSACIGAGADFADYYEIALTAGDRISLTVAPSLAWMPLWVGMLDTYTSYYLNGVKQPDGKVVLNYTVPENGTYIFYVNGAANYMLRMEKLN